VAGSGSGGGRNITVRRIAAVLAGALVAAAAALLLGEYPFSGLLVVGSGVLVGLLVSEAVVAVADWRGPAPAAAGAVLAATGLVWAAWIAEAHDLGRVAVEGWVAVALGAAAAAVRAWRPRAGAGSPRSPASSP
jgi:hypothetical protein